MTITEQTTAFAWQQATWQEAEDYVSRFTDRLGTPLEAGIIETVIVLNLLGLRTFQSCEGHLRHGCAYPWVSLIDPPLSGQFVRLWQAVCQLENLAKEADTVEAYDTYLAEHVRLKINMARWEEQDTLYQHLQSLLEGFYAYSKDMQYSPSRLVIVKHHPGMIRLEPFSGQHMQSTSERLKSAYLACGQTEMQAFTRYLKMQWQESRDAASA
ncbi:MAG: hypothetical protein ABI456_07475 [Ktedonobacteraceae bacterium]|nr:hypothetical protein [Chloroflexota bacterium]